MSVQPQMLEGGPAAAPVAFDPRYRFDGPLMAGAARAVADRLRRLGSMGTGPGQCLMTAVAGCAALGAAGVRAVLQAGACYHRRVADPTPGADPRGFYGFAWDPESPESACNLSAGLMPEYHAWCGVPGDPAAGVPACGLVVDFSAALVPDHAALSGIDWPGPRPTSPVVVPAAEARCDPYYAAVEEATLTLSVLARAKLCELAGDGYDVADLWDGAGGPPRPARGPGRRVLADPAEAMRHPASALMFVRRLRKIAAGTHRAGVW